MITAEDLRKKTRSAIESQYPEYLLYIHSRLCSRAEEGYTHCEFSPNELNNITGIIWYLEQKGYKVKWCSQPDRWMVYWD